MRQLDRGGMYSNYIQAFRLPSGGGGGPSRFPCSRRGRPLRGNPLRFPRARLGACPRELQSSPDHSAGSVNRGRFPPNRVCTGRMRVRSPRTRGRFAVARARAGGEGEDVRTAIGHRQPGYKHHDTLPADTHTSLTMIAHRARGALRRKGENAPHGGGPHGARKGRKNRARSTSRGVLTLYVTNKRNPAFMRFHAHFTDKLF